MRGGNERKYLQEQKMNFAIRTVAVCGLGAMPMATALTKFIIFERLEKMPHFTAQMSRLLKCVYSLFSTWSLKEYGFKYPQI